MSNSFTPSGDWNVNIVWGYDPRDQSFTFICNEADLRGNRHATQAHRDKRKTTIMSLLKKYNIFSIITPNLGCIRYWSKGLDQQELGVDYNVFSKNIMANRQYLSDTVEYSLFRRPCLYFIAHTENLDGKSLMKTGSAGASNIIKRIATHAKDLKADASRQVQAMEDSTCFGMTVHSIYYSTEKRTYQVGLGSGKTPDQTIKTNLIEALRYFDDPNHDPSLEEKMYKYLKDGMARYDPQIRVLEHEVRTSNVDSAEEKFKRLKEARTKPKNTPTVFNESVFNEKIVEESLKTIFPVSERFGIRKSSAEWYILDREHYVKAFNKRTRCPPRKRRRYYGL